MAYHDILRLLSLARVLRPMHCIGLRMIDAGVTSKFIARRGVYFGLE